MTRLIGMRLQQIRELLDMANMSGDVEGEVYPALSAALADLDDLAELLDRERIGD